VSKALVQTYAHLPFRVRSGAGAKIEADDGRTYWDLYGGHAVAILGHSHPRVAAAIAEQANSLAFYSNVVELDIRDRAAERLCAFAPDGLDHVFFCNSGAEANENALKIAIQRTGRTKIAALGGAFHGRTALALAATASPLLRSAYEKLLCPCERIRANNTNDLRAIDKTVAAVIVEPIQSIAGVIELTGPYLQALSERCKAVGAMLIYDEVQTGMGRLGRPMASGEHDVVPDMATMAKGIANGFPMGALLVSPNIAKDLTIGDLGSTFGGGPMACAAALAVLETIESEQLMEHAEQIELRVRERLVGEAVSDVYGRGCLLGLRTRGEAKLMHRALLSRGFITGTSGDPHVLRLLPPINLPLQAIDELAGALNEIGAASDATLAEYAGF
jgi:acetylornithine/succinyldiaminopimelate/putrescine aminotransferase